MKIPNTRTEKLHELCSVWHHDMLLMQINNHSARGEHKRMDVATLKRYKNWGKKTKMDETPQWMDSIIDSLYTQTFPRNGHITS